MKELSEKKYAPVVLFVYNRLLHTRNTVEALCRNEEIADTDLIIYSDGPKDETAREQIKELRRYLHTITGFKSVHIIQREENWGLSKNIIQGVTEVVKEYGKIIVLEDDIVVSSCFLRYMNTALERYKDSKKVMEISGYSYPIRKQNLPETVFLKFGDCWGWGTWADRWRLFDKNPDKLIHTFKRKDIFHFNLENSYDFWKQVQQNYKKEIDTWAVFWYASIYMNDGLMLYPRDSMVTNIGFDSSGEHCSAHESFDRKGRQDQSVQYYNTDIKEDEQTRKRLSDFFRKQKDNLFKRILRKLCR